MEEELNGEEAAALSIIKSCKDELDKFASIGRIDIINTEYGPLITFQNDNDMLTGEVLSGTVEFNREFNKQVLLWRNSAGYDCMTFAWQPSKLAALEWSLYEDGGFWVS